MKNENGITEKEWLDLAWKYFQQHAQQRISYFNFFVIFSTILTTGYISTFQTNIRIPYIGLFIGLLQVLVSITFLKIELRNKFLTKNAEDVIKNIEKEYDKTGDKKFSLFCIEDLKTQNLSVKNKKSFFLFKQWTHGQTYLVFYLVYFGIGLLMSASTVILKPKASDNPENEKSIYNYEINVKKNNSLPTKIDSPLKSK
jgi:hypothetical protein